jgi:hypothetical protein
VVVVNKARRGERQVSPPGLVVRLAKRDQPEELRARGLDRPFYTAAFDFALLPR